VKTEAEAIEEMHLRTLQNLGFGYADASKALVTAGQDVKKAAKLLLASQ
jgi:hypothetical protein